MRFVSATIRSIDPVAKRVSTDDGDFDADILVVALGADLDPGATPGLLEAGHEFYTVAGAFALRDVLENFAGGHVFVGVTSTPFKCPPAPSETALLVHDLLAGPRLAGLLERVVGHADGCADTAVTRRIRGAPDRVCRAWDRMASGATGSRPRPGSARWLCSTTAARCHLTCSSVCRCTVHLRSSWSRAWRSTAGSRLIRSRLETTFPGVYAVGDVTSVGTPKAGVFAEGQALVVASAIAAQLRGRHRPPPTTGRVCVIWSSGEMRSRRLTSPSAAARCQSAAWKAHRRSWSRIRSISAQVASSAGSAAAQSDPPGSATRVSDWGQRVSRLLFVV